MRATDKQRGFTLLEIMVVIVIIGVLASLVVPNLMGNKEKADKQKAVSDIVALEKRPGYVQARQSSLSNHKSGA
ncbi:General secretion pathway protein G [Escherichia coli ISC41]|nr:General secretion pathway protein G [Escherichia coli ISC41]